MKKKLLFVTYCDAQPENGLSYVIELAKIMHEDLTIFLLKKRRISRQVDELMTAVTFAEANEQETARQMVTGDCKEDVKIPDRLLGTCYQSGIHVDICSSRADVVSAVKECLRQRNGIDIVLLAPNITEREKFTGKKLQRLMSTVTRPLVTLSRQQSAVPA